MTALLEAVDLTYAYHRRADPVLHGVGLAVQPGESVGLVGESGAGKTTILRLLLGLDSPTDGEVRFDGRPLDLRDRTGMRAFRRAVQPVYQDPFSSLDPRMPIGASIAEPLRSLGIESSPQARRAIVAGLRAGRLHRRHAVLSRGRPPVTHRAHLGRPRSARQARNGCEQTPRVRLLRLGEQALRVAGLDDPAVLQHDGPRRER